MRTPLLMLAMACGSVEPRLDCEQPYQGDLDGYCILGENDGATAAAIDLATCADPPTEPADVARGPGGCDEPSTAVLEAEQAAYVRCWDRAYSDAMPTDTADTGPCEPSTTDPAPFP